MKLPILMCANCGLSDDGPHPDPNCKCQQKDPKEDHRLEYWPVVSARMFRVTRGKPLIFRLVAQALAKYDYFSAPSNWEGPHFQNKVCRGHEYEILRWTRWTIKERRFRGIVRDYLLGRIPRGLDLLLDFYD